MHTQSGLVQWERAQSAPKGSAPYLVELAGVWMVHNGSGHGDWMRGAISTSLSAHWARRTAPSLSSLQQDQLGCHSSPLCVARCIRFLSSTSVPGVSILVRSAMAVMAATMSVTAASVRQFEGLKATTSFTKPLPSLAMRKTAGKGALGARCDYIGSSTNLIMVASTTLMLFAGRFGLAPSANRMSTAGLKLVDRDSGLQTGDPAGFTATDTLACGAMGHVIGVGVVLGLKAIGSL